MFVFCIVLVHNDIEKELPLCEICFQLKFQVINFLIITIDKTYTLKN